jgi:hypothetical protein
MSAEALENLISLADKSTSRKLVIEVIRTAYALGKFDAVIERTLAEISERRQELDSRREVLS